MIRKEGGFTIVGLMVAVAVINIGLAVAVTSWITLDQRAREAELIWRGRQYVRALACHQRANGGALPLELEDLLEADCIRRLYPDPMTGDGEWRVIRFSELASILEERELRVGVSGEEDGSEDGQVGEGGGRRGRADDVGEGQGGLGGQSLMGRMRERLEARRRELIEGSLLRGGQLGPGRSGDAIVGVASRSDELGFRIIDGSNRYSDWLFVLGSGAPPGGG